MQFDKKAFTLAEVLITLGVIGIVAAMTIPMLMTKYEKIRNVNQLKKIYSELSQSFRAASEENDIYNLGDNWTDTTAVIEAIKPYLKITDVFLPEGNMSKTMCYNEKLSSQHSVMKPAQYRWLNGVYISTPFSNNTSSVQLINGACVGFGRGLSRVVYIDINGSYNLPNMAGKDLFFFEITPSGSFVPLGSTYTNERLTSPSSARSCNKNSSVGAGEPCAALIIREGWEISYY